MIPYILHVALITCFCWLFYKGLLEKETFFRLNRVFLSGGLLISFALPFIRVPEQWSWQKDSEQSFFATGQAPVSNPAPAAPNLSSTPAVPVPAPEGPSPTVRLLRLLPYAYWIGVCIFGFNLLLQLIVLGYQVVSRPSIRDGKYRIIETTGNKAPCSFGNWVFINPEKYDWETYNLILLHEKIHIDQKHTADFLLAELCLVFQWFNPFAWKYRRELESNIEFLTDHSLLSIETIQQREYELSLLKVSAPQMPLGITTNYNQSLLKKRVDMMNTKKSSISTMWKYLFICPLLTALIILLNKPAALAQQDERTGQANTHAVADVQQDFADFSSGTWQATVSGNDVSIALSSRSKDGNFSATILAGRQELSTTSDGGFELRRAAGTLQCKGHLGDRSGKGTYTFAASSDFGTALGKYGFHDAGRGTQFILFLGNITTDYIEFLQANGYAGLSLAQLQQLSLQQFSLDELKAYLAIASSANLGALPVEKLVAMKTMGVTPQYIRSIRNAGYQNVSLEELMAARTNGIDSTYIAAQMRDRKDLSMEQIILSKVRAHEASGRGKGGGTGEEDMSATDPRTLNRVGGSLDDAYAAYLKKLGYSGLSDDEVHAARNMGLDEGYISSLRSMGYSNLPFEKLLALKTMTVTPQYIQDFRQLGYTNIPLNTLLRLKTNLVDATYIKELQDMSFKNISLDQAVELKIYGITPAYILSKRQEGTNLKTLQEYLELKQKGG